MAKSVRKTESQEPPRFIKSEIQAIRILDKKMHKKYTRLKKG